jgi:hypothetical protein
MKTCENRRFSYISGKHLAHTHLLASVARLGAVLRPVLRVRRVVERMQLGFGHVLQGGKDGKGVSVLGQ